MQEPQGLVYADLSMMQKPQGLVYADLNTATSVHTPNTKKVIRTTGAMHAHAVSATRK